ncbi:putative cyclin-dependent serine/threonine-protein kinase DDB_G0272797/DDB_G0274007 [Anopheles nili]|uniref:putative cyclin-dependent serine/threonine-protein kinase DDB_G0272797/DDB_G0274007 n=1 Tax=Anopheles nili TaxID=185578 RepID=UPI00237BFA15|nr:putative cyclin-dependent serine/threonine-protein kinase DDB_G0272797/DDB_G0274007 [Anopheles nili]
MLEKEPDSMAVTMKQDYAASEVYSTTSEAPPAYKMRQANSVKIAKIIAITVVLSSFILGSFILASSYLQAKQSCDQMQALDAVLNKELMLEAMQQELPKAQALMQDNLSADEGTLQTIDRDDAKKRKQEEARKQHKEDSDESTDSDDEDDSSNDGESDESMDMNNRHHVNLPLDLHLTDLANAILRENQKSRMNCIVERRRSEELVDAPPKMVRLPFGMDLASDPKQQKVTGERIAIFCESGNELKNEDAEPVRQVLIPIPPVRTFGPITHLPQQMGPGPQTIIRQMPRPIFQMSLMNPHHQPPQPQQPSQQPQQLPPIPAQMMQAPHPDAPMGRPNFHPFLQQLPQIMAAQMHQQAPPQPQPGMPPRTEVRIHLQRIPIPEIMRPFLPPQIIRQQAEPEQQQPSQPQPPQQQPQQQEVQIREMPIDMAMQKFGMPSSDELNVADFAAQKFTEQLRSLIARIADSEESDEETDSYRNAPNQEGPSPHSDERELQEQQPPRPTEPEMVHQDEQEPAQQPEQTPEQAPQQQPEPQPMLPMGRIHYGRSLLTPISLPGKVVETSASEEDAVRPHYVQPRSV